MRKQLILAIDRDDDFGEKGHVITPVIGIEKATEAVMALGSADPEDSDVNSLLAAISNYKQLKEEGKDVEVALICGDKIVGNRSDEVIREEFIQVISAVEPDGVILVSDGAEDDQIIPMIQSYIPIDRTVRVDVKQVKSVEKSFYIMKKMLSDPQKRKRFLVPLGALLCMIALIYIAVDLIGYFDSYSTSYLMSMATPLVVFVIGFLILLYGYNSLDRFVGYADQWREQVRSSSVSLTFSLMALVLIIVGIVLGINSVKNMMENGFIYIFLVFASYILWPIAFAIFLTDVGKALDQYVAKKKVARSFMTKTISTFGVAFIIQGAIDYTRKVIGYGTADNNMILLEFVMGIAFTLISSIIHVSYKKYYKNIDGAKYQ